jgi:peptidoglycan-N-acetylglucosamine deacetylase
VPVSMRDWWERRRRRTLMWYGARLRRLPRVPGAVLGIFCDLEGHYGGPEAARQSERGLDLLLAVLREHGVKITFNVVADLCRTHPQQISRIAQAGHEIACHGWRHERPRDLSASEIDAALRNTIDSFASIGLQPRGFRSPQSAWSPALLHRLPAHGYVWNAERERRIGVEPYLIHRRLVRVPVTSDDWDLADHSGTPATLLEKWQICVDAAQRQRAIVCLGIHEWIVGGSEDYASRLWSFLGEVRAKPGLRLRRLGEIAG